MFIQSSTRLIVITLFMSLLLGGCSIVPEALDAETIKRINKSDREAAMAGMVPVGETIALAEAVARALKYNLDQRTRRMEQALAVNQLEAGKYDMLPRLLANAGYAWRNNDNVRFSADPATSNDISNSSLFISSEREHLTRDLTFSWSLLDFGASYYTAKQNADRVLIASERRRHAMHILIQNVRATYWRAVAGETLEKRVRTTIMQAEKALNDSRRLSNERVRAPAKALRYQRNLLESMRLLENIGRELASARIELTSLMGLIPGTPYKLIEPVTRHILLPDDIGRLEEIALLQNANLREEFYNVRIAAHNTRKALLQLLPGISFDYARQYDDDFFLRNNQWKEAGIRVSFNLFNLLSGPSRMNAAEKNVLLARSRRMALQMTVLAQVHLSSNQYKEALRQYNRTNDIYEVDIKLEEIVKSKYKSQLTGKLSRISANVTTILSQVRRYQSLAKVEEALGRLQTTLGTQPNLPSMDDAKLGELTRLIGRWMTRAWIGESNEAAVPVKTSRAQ